MVTSLLQQGLSTEIIDEQRRKMQAMEKHIERLQGALREVVACVDASGVGPWSTADYRWHDAIEEARKAYQEEIPHG